MSAVAILGLGALGLLALASTASAASKSSMASTKKSSTKKASKKKVSKKKASQLKRRKLKNQLLRAYARKFLRYVNKGGRSRLVIKNYQKRIGASTTGIADGQSEKRIEKILGYNVSWKPKKKVVRPSVFTSRRRPVKSTRVRRRKPTIRRAPPKPSRAVKVKPESDPITSILSTLMGKKAAAPKPKRAKTPVKKTTPARRRTVKALPASTTTRKTVRPKRREKIPQVRSTPTKPAPADNVVAAAALDKYLRSGGLERSVVKGYQKRMGELAADGVAGPLTLSRATDLLGRELVWPHISAAHSLRRYYRDKGRNRDVIRGYQSDMGELVVDGLVGRKTKKRYRALTGKKW